MDNKTLRTWQERLTKDQTAYQSELDRMDEREKLFRGKTQYKGFVKNDRWEGKDVLYNYNIIAENIEAQVSSDIPMPKVTPRRQTDERLAMLIENMLRNELDRLPMELHNDLAERTVPIQGGGYYCVEWDNRQRSNRAVGENAVSFYHPKWVIPQEGVYTGVEDMDHIILKIPQTKASVRARYGVDVEDETESEPDIKAVDGDESAEDMVTMYVAYYRNDRGGIGKFAWVNDTVLEDLEDYQARRLKRCAGCGRTEPAPGTMRADGEREWQEGDPCPDCGTNRWEEREEEYEEVDGPVYRTDGTIVPGTENGARIPYYKPDRFPVVLQRNVSVYGQLLGESDVDKIESQQHGLNRLELKIFERMMKAGSKITLPPDPAVRIDPEDQEVIRLQKPEDKSMIDAYNFSGDLSQELYQVNAIYQHARQAIGVTDSFQGRVDNTATSGKAKEFSAAQAAGRLESKRTMKELAYAEIFRLMTQFRIAYADEPRPVVYQDENGDTRYDSFSRWDFLEYDEENGQFWWNDQFLFSCDTSAPLAKNRERMWQETQSFFAAGAFGDPMALETRVAFWTKMELLHYPGAAQTKKNLQEQLEKEQASMGIPEASGMGPGGMSQAEIESMARQAAMAQAADEAAGAAAAKEMGLL